MSPLSHFFIALLVLIAEPKMNIDMEINTEIIPELEEREGQLPNVGGYVPHQQYSDNSPKEVMEGLCDYLFSLPGVTKIKSNVSLPSALGAYIEGDFKVNPQVGREFTHIHTEPGPGSLHMILPRDICREIIDKKWGVYHPMSEGMKQSPTGIILIYAPRDERDLEALKKIIDIAYYYAIQ